MAIVVRHWLAAAAGALACAFADAPPAHAAQRLMQCSSIGYRYQYCGADTQGRVVLLRELSTGNLCRQGRGWGFDNGGIWVDRGCRGEFSYGRDDGGSWDRPGQLVCESISYRYRYCNANTQNRVSLVREISTGHLCRQGSGWGYDAGGIWVDRGCRGEFRYGQDNRRRNDAAIAEGIVNAFALGTTMNAQVEPPPPQSYGPAPAWAVGSFQAWDPISGETVQLIVTSDARVFLRNETGALLSQGRYRDGMVNWSSGKRSWFAREGPGVMIGDIDTNRHYYFRRSA